MIFSQNKLPFLSHIKQLAHHCMKIEHNIFRTFFMTKTYFWHHSLTYRSKSPSLFSSCCVVRPSAGSVAGVTSTSSLACQPSTRTIALVLQVSWIGGQTSSCTHSKPCSKNLIKFSLKSMLQYINRTVKRSYFKMRDIWDLIPHSLVYRNCSGKDF